MNPDTVPGRSVTSPGSCPLLWILGNDDDFNWFLAVWLPITALVPGRYSGDRCEKDFDARRSDKSPVGSNAHVSLDPLLGLWLFKRCLLWSWYERRLIRMRPSFAPGVLGVPGWKEDLRERLGFS
eukprot:638123-Prorocentrum_minimum.AAC.3